MKKQLDTKKIIASLTTVLQQLSRYKALLFVVMIALVYGYILLTINSLSNRQPSSNQVSAQANPITTARVNENVIKQLKQLEDNNVSVKELFNEARNNPFVEE
ncbi:MAG: hypothetical protein JWN38_865 [Candidatus Saccharibacteria bacterium]|nr:hypothetical protein [Candidatus Saccharibacteria bacterium]